MATWIIDSCFHRGRLVHLPVCLYVISYGRWYLKGRSRWGSMVQYRRLCAGHRIRTTHVPTAALAMAAVLSTNWVWAIPRRSPTGGLGSARSVLTRGGVNATRPGRYRRAGRRRRRDAMQATIWARRILPTLGAVARRRPRCPHFGRKVLF